jgi:hypothetical protein
LAKKFIAADEEHRRKLLAGLLASPSKNTELSPEQLSELEAQHRLLEERKLNNPPPRVGYDELARAVGAQGTYDIYYRFLSMFAHPVPSGTTSELIRREGKIIAVRSGPDFSDAYENFARLTLFLLTVLDCAARIFRLPLADDLRALFEARKKLIEARRRKSDEQLPD